MDHSHHGHEHNVMGDMATTTPPPPSLDHQHMHHMDNVDLTMNHHHGMLMAMGSNSSHSMMDHMMKMYFHFGYDETVLFEFWKVASASGLIGSMFGIFFMAALYEGLKYYREYLFWKTYHALQYRSVQVPVKKSVVNTDEQVVHVVGEVIHKQPPTMFSISHGYQTVLHIIQIVLSYMLMLIFMTYNIWLCVAVVLGSATGYFLFGWKKSIIVDVTEHCH